MTTLKSFTIVATLLVGGISLAIAQNGPAMGGEHPVAGGAAGGGGAYDRFYRHSHGHLYNYWHRHRHYWWPHQGPERAAWAEICSCAPLRATPVRRGISLFRVTQMAKQLRLLRRRTRASS